MQVDLVYDTSKPEELLSSDYILNELDEAYKNVREKLVQVINIAQSITTRVHMEDPMKLENWFGYTPQ